MFIDIPVDQTPVASCLELRPYAAIYEPHKGLSKPNIAIQRNASDKPFTYLLSRSIGKTSIDNIENQGTIIPSFRSMSQTPPLSVNDYALMMADYDVAAIEDDHHHIASKFGW